MVQEIEKFSSLSEPDIRGVIIALENAIQNKLASSRIVRMEKLGTFYPTLSNEGTEKAEDITSVSIKSVGINYRPGDRLKKRFTMPDSQSKLRKKNKDVSIKR
ncbi:hypothetical protein MASR2M117_08430 [Paludibacter sp.]